MFINLNRTWQNLSSKLQTWPHVTHHVKCFRKVQSVTINPWTHHSTENKNLYTSLIRSIQHLKFSTRPNFTLPISTLACFCTKPTTSHMTLLKLVLRYLRGTQHNGLICNEKWKTNVITFADADIALSSDYNFITGMVHKIHHSPIARTSKNQPTAALSTCEAKYIASSWAQQDHQWIKGIATEIKTPYNKVQQYYIRKTPAHWKRLQVMR